MFHTSQWADLPPGNCAKGAPGELDDVMFEDRSPIPSTNNKMSALEAQQNYRAAKRMCVGCPIREQCLTEGMKQENLQFGVFGGLWAGERVMLRNPKSLSPAAQYARHMLSLEAREAARVKREQAREARRLAELEAAQAAAQRRNTCRKGHDLTVHGQVRLDRRNNREYVHCGECKRTADRKRREQVSSKPCAMCSSPVFTQGLCQPHYRRQLLERRKQEAA